MVVVTDPKGMFLDLQEKIKGFITKAEGGRNYMLMLSMLDGMLTKKLLQQKILEMITSLTKTRSWLMMMI
jgi:hypothetical protein